LFFLKNPDLKTQLFPIDSYLSFFVQPPQILYADALDAPTLSIPDTTPRVAAWSQKLLDEFIKLDTNNDGSFGKLKVWSSNAHAIFSPFFYANNTPALIMMSSFLLSPFQLKQLPHTTVQESLFRPEDILQFVASKVPEGMPTQVNLVVFSSAALPPYASGVLMVFSVYLMQDARNISDAVGKLLCGMTVLLGSFVKEIGEARMHAQDTSGPSLRRSKRQRLIQIEDPEDEEESEHEQELDDEEDEWEDIDTEEDEDDEGEEDG
jgi:hypothetical protein